MNNMRKNIVLSIIVIFMGLAIAGGTFAWLTGTLTVNNGNYTAVSDCFLIDYNTSEYESNTGNNLISNIDSLVNISDLGDGVYQVDYTQSTSDTHMKINSSESITNGKSYVLQFNVDGLNDNENVVFGLYYNNGSNGNWHNQRLYNGTNKMIFTYGGSSINYLVFDDSQKANTAIFTMSDFILYEQSQDITGTLFPTSKPSGGLNGHVGLKVNSSCNTYGTGTIKLHIDNTTSSTLTTPIASYCESKKTLQKIDGISTKEACTTANGIWRGYGDSYCENPTTLERITTYTTQSDCESNGGSWTTGGSPLKYALYYNEYVLGTPISVGHISSSDIGHDITLKDDIVITDSQDYYYIYVWLDGYMTDNTFSNLSFSGSISASAIQNNEANANAYTITFDANGGTVDIPSKTVVYGEDYGTLPTPTRNGYTFLGWNGKNLLNINAQKSIVSNLSSSNSTKRTFEANTYVFGLAFNNYYSNDLPLDYKRGDNYISFTSTSGYGVAFPIISEANKTYSISLDIEGDSATNAQVSLLAYKMDGTFITHSYASYSGNVHVNRNFTIPSETYYLVAQFGIADYEHVKKFKNIQLEEGSTATAYEPYFITGNTTVVQDHDHTLKAIWKKNDIIVTRSVMDKGEFKNVTPIYLTNQVAGSDGFQIVGTARENTNTEGCRYCLYSKILRWDYRIDLTNYSKITFYAKKNENHGVIRVAIGDGIVDNQSVPYYLAVHYNSAPTEYTYYEVDVSNIVGTKVVSFVGGYIDSSGSVNSSTSYCNIKFIRNE